MVCLQEIEKVLLGKSFVKNYQPTQTIISNMFLNISIGILFNLILLCQGGVNKSEDGFSYPHDEDKNPANQNIKHKQPVQNSRCKDGEYLYPGDQGDDWVCDCIPGFIYYPNHNSCYEAYTRGPCGNHQYLILPTGKVIPECTSNHCETDYVTFQGNCHKIKTVGPCPNPELGNRLEINETSLEVVCSLGLTPSEVKSNHEKKLLESRVGEAEPQKIVPNETPKYPLKVCLYGGIRWNNERCPEQLVEHQFENRVTSIFNHPTFSATYSNQMPRN